MFFIIPISVDYRTQRYPVIVFSTIGVCVLLYVVSWILFLTSGESMRTFRDPLIFDWGLVPAQKTFFTWFTHMFVHADIFHLLGNMIYLFLFGAVVEDTIKRPLFTTFYLLGGLGAALLHVVMSGSGMDSQIPMVGASGAISTCLGGFVLLHPKTHIEFRYVYWLYMRAGSDTFSLPSWSVISFWFLLDLVSAFLLSEGGSGIAFGAHVGGFVTGIGLMSLGLLITKNTRSDETKTQTTSPISNQVSKPTPDQRCDLYVLTAAGDQMGPYTKTQVQQFLDKKIYGSEDFFTVAGWDEWQPMDQFQYYEEL